MALNKVPSFQEVKDWAEVNVGVPSGAIMLNTNDGGTIPQGFVLCDGNNGTPDLRGKYVKGASGTGDEGSTGGSNTVTLSESELPSHSHDFDIDNVYSDSDHSGTGAPAAGDVSGLTGDRTTRTFETGGGSAHPNEPAYTELRYMMKV